MNTYLDSLNKETLPPKLYYWILPLTYFITGETEQKIAAVGVIKILTEGPAMFNENYVKFWAPLLDALVQMFEESVDTTTPQVMVLCLGED